MILFLYLTPMKPTTILFLLGQLLTFSLAFGQQQDSSAVKALYDRILSLDEEIRNNPNRQVSNFSPSDTASLPIGIVKEIGNTIYVICIDSARFTRQGSFFSVYMALDLPGAGRKIAFAAKNIQFNPKGVLVSQGARLQLVSQQTVSLGPKTSIVFKANGRNFIEWDCGGYKQAGLSLDFVFSPDLFINALDPTAPVKAGLELVVQDLNNISFQLPQMTPFRVKGAEDFIFQLNDVVIDRSEITTPQGVVLPLSTLQLYNENINAWKGFFAQNVTVSLPPKLSPSTGATQVYAHNLIIDDSGLSGAFGATNLFAAGMGKMDGKWGFSISRLEVNLANNHITNGLLEGLVTVEPLDNQSFTYSASISQVPNQQTLDYNFTIGVGSDTVSFNAFRSKLNLNPNSTFTVQSVQNRFIPSLKLNGNWTLDAPKAKFKGVAFQNLLITSNAPYVTGGTFSLVSSNSTAIPGNKCVGFNISLNSVSMTITPDKKLVFAVGVGMSLGSENNQVSFGVSTGINVRTKLETNPSGAERLVFDNFSINNIQLSLHTSPFNLDGIIAIRNDDPVFGDLFFGSISLSIKNILDQPIMVSAGFGKMPTYKYWFTDAAVPITIPLVPGLKIKSLYGGVQNRVASTQTTEQLLNRVAGQITSGQTNAGVNIPFTPDANQGLLFRAGVSLQNDVEKVFNGDVLLSIAFNPNGGFQSIDFMGKAYMMVTRQQRQLPNVKKVWGTLSVSYNNVQKVFDANLVAAIIVPGTLTGGLNIKAHIDQNNWYFWLNRPSNRAYLNLVNVFNVNTYFMIGTQIDPIPAPPSYITQLVGSGNIGAIDLNAVGNGNGFAMGTQFLVNFGGEFPKDTKWRGFVDLSVGGGFDILLFNAQNAHCAGSSEAIGVNGYYAMGQVYAYLNGALGVKKYKNGNVTTYNLGSLQVAALLQGKLPKPSYVYGAIGIQANILGIIDFTFTADIELGTNCNLVGV